MDAAFGDAGRVQRARFGPCRELLRHLALVIDDVEAELDVGTAAGHIRCDGHVADDVLSFCAAPAPGPHGVY